MNLVNIPVSSIVHSRSYSDMKQRRSYNPEIMEELTSSIRANGVKSPLCVTSASDNGMYMVIDGDHRLDAVRKIGMKEVPAVIAEDVAFDDEDAASTFVTNYILNSQRYNMTFAESARLVREVITHREEVSEEVVKKKMGLSDKKYNRYITFAYFPEDVQDYLVELGLAEEEDVINFLKDMTDENRMKYLAVIKDKNCNRREAVEILSLGKEISKHFLYEIQSRFNDMELPYNESVVELLKRYDTVDGQRAIIEKLEICDDESIAAALKARAKVAEKYNRVIDNTDGCPEAVDLLPHMNFPLLTTEAEAFITSIHALRDALPEDQETRHAVLESLMSLNRLDADNLTRVARSITVSFQKYPEEIRNLFTDGYLPFNDHVFRALDVLQEKDFDIETKLDLIEKASQGNYTPEIIGNNLIGKIREEDMRRQAASAASTSAQVKTSLPEKENKPDVPSIPQDRVLSPEEIFDDIEGFDEEDKKFLRSIGEQGHNDPASVEGSVVEEILSDPDSDNIDEQKESEEDLENANQDLLSGKYGILADSLARYNHLHEHNAVTRTNLQNELDILENSVGKQKCLGWVFKAANEICANCREQQLFTFRISDLCISCGLTQLMCKLQDEAGEVDLNE